VKCDVDNFSQLVSTLKRKCGTFGKPKVISSQDRVVLTFESRKSSKTMESEKDSVGDPDPEPEPDPHVLGLPDPDPSLLS
jgi:hypothetical protein